MSNLVQSKGTKTIYIISIGIILLYTPLLISIPQISLGQGYIWTTQLQTNTKHNQNVNWLSQLGFTLPHGCAYSKQGFGFYVF